MSAVARSRRPATLARRLSAAAALWRRSLGLVVAAAPRQAAALVALMVMQAFLPVGTLWSSRAVVDAAARAFGLTTPAADGGAGLPLPAWIGIAVMLIVAQQLLVPLSHLAQESASDWLIVHVNGELFAATNRWRGLARFEDAAFADELENARQNAANGPVQLLAYGGETAQAVFTVAAMSAMLWRLHPLAPVLLVLAHVPQAVQENEFGQLMANTMETEGAEGRQRRSYLEAVLGVTAAKDVRLFALGSFFGGLYGAAHHRMTADVWAVRRRLLGRMTLFQALAGAASAAVYLYAVRRVLAGCSARSAGSSRATSRRRSTVPWSSACWPPAGRFLISTTSSARSTATRSPCWSVKSVGSRSR